MCSTSRLLRMATCSGFFFFCRLLAGLVGAWSAASARGIATCGQHPPSPIVHGWCEKPSGSNSLCFETPKSIVIIVSKNTSIRSAGRLSPILDDGRGQVLTTDDFQHQRSRVAPRILPTKAWVANVLDWTPGFSHQCSRIEPLIFHNEGPVSNLGFLTHRS